MTTYYKLTSANGTTRNGMQWAPGVTNRAEPGECKCCTKHALHVYETPELAVMLEPLHVSGYTRMFEVEAIGIDVRWDKIGCAEVTCVRELPMPVVSTAARVRFAILCALEVWTDAAWRAWAELWLSGEDRSAAAAAAVERAARAAAYSGKQIDFAGLAHKAITDEATFGGVK